MPLSPWQVILSYTTAVLAAQIACVAQVLHEKMPFGPCPERDDRRWKPFRTQIQKALVETVAVLESDFAKQGLKDGSTLTVVVLVSHRGLVSCA